MNVGTHVTDREAYDWLRDTGLPDERDEPQLAGEFEGYQLPPFPTWSRYVRCARKTLGQQKYSRRAGRSTGRTVLPERETEFLDWSQS